MLLWLVLTRFLVLSRTSTAFSCMRPGDIPRFLFNWKIYKHWKIIITLVPWATIFEHMYMYIVQIDVQNVIRVIACNITQKTMNNYSNLSWLLGVTAKGQFLILHKNLFMQGFNTIHYKKLWKQFIHNTNLHDSPQPCNLIHKHVIMNELLDFNYRICGGNEIIEKFAYARLVTNNNTCVFAPFHRS